MAMRLSCYIWNQIENTVIYWYTSVMDIWTVQSDLLCLQLVVCIKVFGTELPFILYTLSLFSPWVYPCEHLTMHAWPVLLVEWDLFENANEITVFQTSQSALCGLMVHFNNLALQRMHALYFKEWCFYWFWLLPVLFAFVAAAATQLEQGGADKSTPWRQSWFLKALFSTPNT